MNSAQYVTSFSDTRILSPHPLRNCSTCQFTPILMKFTCPTNPLGKLLGPESLIGSRPPLAPPRNSHILHDSSGALSESPADYMDISLSQEEPHPYHPIMHDSLMVQFPICQLESQPESHSDATGNQVTLPIHLNKLGRLGSLKLGKKHAKWSLSRMFGRDTSRQNSLPLVDKTRPVVFAPWTRAKPSSKGNGSMHESSPSEQLPAQDSGDVKMDKKEAERLYLKTEREKRGLAGSKLREEARLVLHKREQLIRKTVYNEI